MNNTFLFVNFVAVNLVAILAIVVFIKSIKPIIEIFK